jgi:hypothetical protein
MVYAVDHLAYVVLEFHFESGITLIIFPTDVCIKFPCPSFCVFPSIFKEFLEAPEAAKILRFVSPFGDVALTLVSDAEITFLLKELLTDNFFAGGLEIIGYVSLIE